ncbi:MAG: ACT domain-containing protein [Firmicutes bacterium]|nr:ACT domain-containing protein [Bacillota bacterium]
MSIRQLSMFVENKKGALAKVLKCFSDRGVGLRAMTIADTKDFGILRVIVDDIDGAVSALKEEEIVFSVNDVIAAEAQDVPGGLASVLNTLMDAGIDIEYTYAFVVESGDRACAILRVSDVETGEKVLKDAGVPLVSEDEILRI